MAYESNECKNLDEQLEDLLSHQAGWDGENAEPVIPACAKLAYTVLSGIQHTVTPHMYPVQDGRVDAEYTGNEIWMTFDVTDTRFFFREEKRIETETVEYPPIKENDENAEACLSVRDKLIEIFKRVKIDVTPLYIDFKSI